MKLLVLALLAVLAAFTWWRSRSRLTRALRIVIVAYLAMTAYRIVTGVEDDQLIPLVGFFAFFAALWGLSWLVTQAVTASRRS
jgi:hypothetical protein